MSESAKGSGAPADASGAQTGAETKETKTITNPDLDRALKDLHKYKTQAKELADKTQTLEQEKLMAEGKKDELISQLQKQLNETKTKQSEMQKTFAWDKVQNWLKTKAATSGIVDGGAVDKFVSLVDLKGRNPFRDDSTFQLEENVLSQVFEESKKEMPYFFGKPGPSVKDITPNGGVIEGGMDFSKMTLDQLKEKAKDLSKRN
jgi:hypothetical protein